MGQVFTHGFQQVRSQAQRRDFLQHIEPAGLGVGLGGPPERDLALGFVVAIPSSAPDEHLGELLFHGGRAIGLGDGKQYAGSFPEVLCGH
jgi:hypothetical protein